MGEDIGGANRRIPAYLEDEPIYCAAPSPSTSDAVSPKSIDKVGGTAKAARIQRYEENGRRYLQGRPLRILSAGLYGPFDRASGWQNPWLPKPTSQHHDFPIDASRLLNCSTAEQHGSNIILNNLPDMEARVEVGETEEADEEEDDEGEGRFEIADDSMECQLPSPQSHADLQSLQTPSSLEKRFRISSWAKNIEGPCLEKDKFWAPDQGSVNRPSEYSKKRPTSTEWLKRRPAKKTRPYASQSPVVTSTPTPFPTELPRPKNKKASAIAQRSANRSFEMTTPSSSTDQGPRDSLDVAEHHARTWEEEKDVQISEHQSSRDMLRNNRSTEVAGKADRRETIITSHLRSLREKTYDGEEMDKISNFHSCADESFLYRARLIKSAAMVTGIPPQPTRADTPVSFKHLDKVVVSSHTDTERPSLGRTSVGSAVSRLQHIENPDGLVLEEEGINLDGTRPIVSPIGPTEGDKPALQNCDVTNTNTDASNRNTGSPLSNVTSNGQANRPDPSNVVPKTLIEVKITQDASPDTPLDGGLTLVGEPMEVDRSGAIQAAQETPDDRVSHQSDSADGVDTGEAARYGGTGSPYNTLTPKGDANTVSPSHTTKPEHEFTKPNQESQQTISNVAIVPNNVAHGSIINVTAGNEDAPPGPLGSLPSPHAADSSFITRGNDTEQIVGVTSVLQIQPVVASVSSLIGVQNSPAIRPSQQSPWAKEVTEARYIVAQDRDVNTTAAAFIGAGSARELQGPEPPTDQEQACSSGLSPAVQPMSNTSPEALHSRLGQEPSTWRNQEPISSTQEYLYTPVPRLARQTTPGAELSIKTFSNFQPSPPRRLDYHSASSANRGILRGRRHLGTGSNTKPSRRVSFAPLPHEQDNSESMSPIKSTRAVSPPPSQIVDMNGENVDGKYHRHFDAMNRRIDRRQLSQLRCKQRLLPSSSQQVPESPSFEAMAEAFREADAQLSEQTSNLDEDKNATAAQEAQTATAEETANTPQSPWHHDSQAIDDVAAVLGNLDQFLDVWDVDAELEKNRAQLEGSTERHEAQSTADMGIFQRIGQW